MRLGVFNPHYGWEINPAPTSDTVSTLHFSRNYLTIQAQQINSNDHSVNPPLLKTWEIALPNPSLRRIDAPGCAVAGAEITGRFCRRHGVVGRNLGDNTTSIAWSGVASDETLRVVASTKVVLVCVYLLYTQTNTINRFISS